MTHSILTTQVLRNIWTRLEPTLPWRMGTVRQHVFGQQRLSSTIPLPFIVPSNLSVREGLRSSSLVDIIDEYRLSFRNDTRGASLVAPDYPTMMVTEELLQQSALQQGLPVLFFAAVLAMETRFAIDVQNGKWDSSNPEKANEKTEWGLLRIPGDMLYLLPGSETCAQLEAADHRWLCLIARAKQPEYVVPIFCQWLADLHKWALGIIGETDRSLQPGIYAQLRQKGAQRWRWQNAFWLAALAYDQGRANALHQLEAETVSPYPDLVAEIANHFCDLVGERQFMPDAWGLNLR